MKAHPMLYGARLAIVLLAVVPCTSAQNTTATSTTASAGSQNITAGASVGMHFAQEIDDERAFIMYFLKKPPGPVLAFAPALAHYDELQVLGPARIYSLGENEITKGKRLEAASIDKYASPDLFFLKASGKLITCLCVWKFDLQVAKSGQHGILGAAGSIILGHKGLNIISIDQSGNMPAGTIIRDGKEQTTISVGKSGEATGYIQANDGMGLTTLSVSGSGGVGKTVYLLKNDIFGQGYYPIALAMGKVATLDKVRAGSYEVRILYISNLNAWTYVIWLRSDSGGDDLIYVVPSKPGAYPLYENLLTQGKLYTADEFFKTILPQAQNSVSLKSKARPIVPKR